jgi:NADH-quinone oxidoreductase subunit C
MTARIVIEKLKTQYPDAVGEPVEFRGDVSIAVAREKLHEVCAWLKQECGFDMLSDLAGVDNYGTDPRFEVVYILYAMTDGVHVRLRVAVPEDDLQVDSVVDLWQTANWHEREAFDMLGIRFRNHPNLKRILMWDGYPHYPLRKDFPLAGIPAELPETAVDAGSVERSDMLGGPFVAPSGTRSSVRREPRQVDTPAENIERLNNPHKDEPV